MLRTRRRSFSSPRPRRSSIPAISALGWCPDRSTIRIALLPPNSWSYQDDEWRRSNVTVGMKNDNFCDTPINNLLCQSLAVKATRVRRPERARPSAVNWQRLPFIVAPVGRGRAGCPQISWPDRDLQQEGELRLETLSAFF